MKIKNIKALGLGLTVSALGGVVLSVPSYAAEVGTSEELTACFASTDEVCTLSTDIVASEAYTIGRAVTLDLDGNSLSYASTAYDLFDIVEGGDLTVTGDGTVNAGRIVFDVDEGKLMVENGTFTGYDAVVYGLNGGEIRINGGKFTGHDMVIGSNNTTGDMNVYISGGEFISSIQATTIYMPTQMDLEISGGTFYGGVVVRMGQIKISDGTFYASGNYDSPNATNCPGLCLAFSGSVWLPSALNLLVGHSAYTSENVKGTDLNLEISGGTFHAVAEETKYGNFGNSDNAFTNAVGIYDVSTIDQNVNVTITGGVFDAGNREPVKYYNREDITGTAGSTSVTEAIVITGGEYTEEPAADEVAEDSEAEFNEDTGTWEVYPKQVDYNEEIIVALTENGRIGLGFEEEFIADRKAEIVADLYGPNDEAYGNYQLTGDGDLLGIADIKLVDRDGEEIPVEDKSITVYIEIDEETYEALSAYDKIEVVYFDDDGVEVERLAGELKSEENEDGVFYWVEFATTHLSGYGVVGVNNPDAPETGRFTKEDGTAIVRNSLFLTLVAFGLFGFGFKLLKLSKQYRDK